MRPAVIAALVVGTLAIACGKAEKRPKVDDRDQAMGAHAGAGGHGMSQSGTGGASPVELGYVGLEGAPIYTRAQRLTSRQWEHAVSDILGFTEPHDLSKSFVRPVEGTSDFDNNERVLFVGVENFRDFELGAEAAAALATSTAEALAAVAAGGNASSFVSVLGRRAFRRPLTDDEQKKYVATFALGEQLYGPGFANGAALVIRALLESPHFLYRTELGPAGEPLNGYEIAAKLSFWLLGTTPSDALLDAASSGELDSDAGIEDAARRMLDDPRATDSMRDFHEQLLAVRQLGNLEKPGVPEYQPSVNAELVLASDAFVDRIFERDLGLTELLTSREAFVGPGLAPLYGMAAPQSPLELRDLGAARAGFFMQVPFLMLWSEGAQSAPIHRAARLQQMTCMPMGAPLHALPVTPPQQPGETNRQRFARLSDPCGAACHASGLDSLGFALESFDGLGRERDLDNGQPIDTSGSYPFAEGIASFADGNELMNLMAKSAQVHTCYAKKVTSYALGRDIVEPDRPLLDSLAPVSQTESLKELAVALVRAPAFRTREARVP
jgi:hypothetical protein